MSRYLNSIVHLIVFLGILILPLVALILLRSEYGLSSTFSYLWGNSINLLVYGLAFYLLTPKLLMRQKALWFYLLTLLLIFISAIIKDAGNQIIRSNHEAQIFSISPGSAYLNRILLLSGFSFSFALLAVLLRFTTDWFKNRQKMLRMELEVKKAELSMLKYQLYPHFLFNTLNNIYALNRKGDPSTGEYMAKLSDTLRYILYNSDEGLVYLSEEFKILQAFIDLEMLRKNDKDFISLDLHTGPVDHKIPPLLLLPLIENAFKHGDGNQMPVIQVYCRSDAGELEFRVHNSKIASYGVKNPDSGIGLQNVQKRLDLSYPNQSRMEVLDQKNSFTVLIKISFDQT